MKTFFGIHLVEHNWGSQVDHLEFPIEEKTGWAVLSVFYIDELHILRDSYIVR